MIFEKQIFLFIFSVLSISLLSDCTEDIIGPEFNFDQYHNPYYKILSVNDSTRIRLALNFEEHKSSNSLTYNWKSNIGLIRGTGESIVFSSPNETGIAIIEVNVADSDSIFHRELFTIKIFQQLVILKADDFTYDYKNVLSSRWERFINFVSSKKIKTSLGIIGNSINYGNKDFYEIIKKISHSEYFEFWNHGYSHRVNRINSMGKKFSEFQNTPYEYQREHLLRTQKLAKERLGIDLHAFCAPGNAIDKNTILALDEIPEIDIWFFGLEESSKLILKRNLEIEYPAHNPVYQNFLNNFKSEKECLVLQIHPNSWNNDQFAEFEKIVDYLILQNVIFITPSEYKSFI